MSPLPAAALRRRPTVGERATPLGWTRLVLIRLVVVLWALQGTPAQSWEHLRDRGLWALEQAIRDARSDVKVLLVASHPDDRYVMPAAWLRFRHGVRVGVLLATRGEGGQNAWGPETGIALGRIRTREAEACAARLGIDLHYLNAPDRGFTRTAAEALEQWNGPRTKAEIAEAIRRVRPDVVATTHHRRETHGHDLALLEMLPEAVAMAGNPAFATPGLDPFEVRRLFVGLAPELVSATEGALVIDVDEMEPVRGETFRRLAYDAMTEEHRSQQPYAPLDELFDPVVPLVPWLVNGQVASRSLISGLPEFWDLLKPASNDAQATDRQDWRRLFDVNLGLANPAARNSAAKELLVALRGMLEDATAECRERIHRRLEALQRVLFHGMSLHIEAEVVGGHVAVAGEQVNIVLRVFKGSEPHADAPVTDLKFEALGGCRFELHSDGSELALRRERKLTVRGSIQIPAAWAERGSPVDRLYRETEFTSPVRLRCSMNIDGVAVEREFALPLSVSPPLELESLPSRILLPANTDQTDLRLKIRRNTRQPVAATLEVKAPPGFVVRGQPLDLSMAAYETEMLISNLTLRVPGDMDAPVRVLLAEMGNHALRVPVHRVDVQVDPTLRVGLVPGRDDATRSVLTALLGDRLRLLGGEDVLLGDLSGYDCIVVDVRAGPSLQGSFHRLLEFAGRPGKRLVVFHHKPGEFNREESGYEGYPFAPFKIGTGRVTQEDAPVKVLAPEHPVLNHPNRIDADDWDGWLHERGLYFPSEFGDSYVPLLAMKDQGMSGDPEYGSLLYARVGDGGYVYCALSLYRQLKILHPGAVRLLANLIHPERP